MTMQSYDTTLLQIMTAKTHNELDTIIREIQAGDDAAHKYLTYAESSQRYEETGAIQKSWWLFAAENQWCALEA